MTFVDQFLAQLETEAVKTRRAIEQLPDGHEDWKPHEKSMPFGRLASTVAMMPGWFEMIVRDDSLDLNPPGGGPPRPPSPATRAERLQAFDGAVDKARAAFKATNEAHLMKPWKLMVAGNVVSEDPRHIVLRDTFMHLAHHRGQLTVYLRQLWAKVPSIYGPSADDPRFD